MKNKLKNIDFQREIVADNEDYQKETPTPRRFKIATNCYLQKFLKYPGVATFHSYPELLHAALLEGNKYVSTYTPQPKQFKINGRRYIPDCRYIKNGKTIYIEIKPRGELVDKIKIPMEEYAVIHGCEFKVISNEELLNQEIKAKNWLSIVRTLISAENEETQGAENNLINWLCSEPELTLRDIVDSNDRVGQRHQEIALYRLAHKGIVKLDIETKPIEYNTRVNLCHQIGE